MTNNNSRQNLGNGIRYGGARPLMTFIDSNGHEWLCDKHVDSDKDFSAQGCWRIDLMPFNRND
ncbi:MAG: hypothetical protein ACOYVF_14760 [Candidatus Zixiibacteriota bacterium]